MKASSNLPVHNLSTGLNYPTIQEAIDASQTANGQTIFVDDGTYYEYVNVTKSIFLLGENENTTIIDGSGTGPVLTLSANNVSILNVTIGNGGNSWSPQDTCIWGNGYSNALIENDIVANVSNGVILYAMSNSTISNDFAEECGVMGLHFDSSSNCTMINNTVAKSFQGIVLEKSVDNSILWNNLINDSLGIDFYASAGNFVEENKFINSSVGMVLDECNASNSFQANNLTNNTCNIIVWGSSIEAFLQNIDASNSVDNKAVYYLTSSHNLLLNPSTCPNIGYLALVNCTNMKVEDIDLSNNKDGILMAQSTATTLVNVTLANTRTNITLAGFSTQSLLVGGLTLFKSNDNLMINSRITNNTAGVCLCQSDDNAFYDNSFVDVDRPIISNFQGPALPPSGSCAINQWDNGLEGNYWSNYQGSDSNHDGIGDTQYTIDANNTDHYPLMGMFHSYNVTYFTLPLVGHFGMVSVISNSTISGFVAPIWLEHPEITTLTFNVTGTDGSTGFCRVSIPTTMMNGTYHVSVNGTDVPYILLPCSNATVSYLYFTYKHSTEQVLIVPEFPSFLVLQLMMVLIAVIIYKNKGMKTRQS